MDIVETIIYKDLRLIISLTNNGVSTHTLERLAQQLKSLNPMTYIRSELYVINKPITYLRTADHAL